MARARSSEENSETAAFVQALYAAGGFATWKEFADAARVQATSLSNWQRGEKELAGGNLLALIQAAAARNGDDAASLALRLARESFADQLALASSHLEQLGAMASRTLDNQEEGLGVLYEIRQRVGGEGAGAQVVPRS